MIHENIRVEQRVFFFFCNVQIGISRDRGKSSTHRRFRVTEVRANHVRLYKIVCFFFFQQPGTVRIEYDKRTSQKPFEPVHEDVPGNRPDGGGGYLIKFETPAVRSRLGR